MELARLQAVKDQNDSDVEENMPFTDDTDEDESYLKSSQAFEDWCKREEWRVQRNKEEFEQLEKEK